MIKVKKKVLIALIGVVILGTSTSFAQKKEYYPKGFRVGFGINGGLPTNNDFDGALGIDARLQYDVTRKTSFTATTGFTHLFSSEGDLGLIPAKLGFKSFFNRNLYFQGELGAGFGTHKGMGNTFIWSPAIGFANKFIDISMQYQRFNDYNTDQLGIRIAYGFSLKNKKSKK